MAKILVNVTNGSQNTTNQIIKDFIYDFKKINIFHS